MINLTAARRFVEQGGDERQRARLAAVLDGVPAPKEIIKGYEAQQNKDGGFAAAPGEPSDLRVTLRVLAELTDLGVEGSPSAERALAYLRRTQAFAGHWPEKTAEVAHRLLTLAPEQVGPVRQALAAATDPVYRLALFYRLEGPRSGAAEALLAPLRQWTATADAAQLAEALTAWHEAGVGASFYPLLAEALDRLEGLQRADGSFAAEPEITLQALRVLQAFGRLDPFVWLKGLETFGIKPGLSRTEQLLARLGHPERQLPPAFHVGGTNGKGSTAAILAAIAQAEGLRVGLYTSPELERFHERIQVNGEPISDEALVPLLGRVRAAYEALAEAGAELPTHFEVVTAAAYLYFSEQELDVVIIEVGLGGRYDATAILPTKVVSIITTVSLDHTRVLGNTVEEIGYDKAGIMVKGVPCLTGSDLPILAEVAEAVGAPLFRVLEGWQIREATLSGQRFDLAPYQDLELNLLGAHQVKNAALALRALEVQTAISVSEPAIRQGLRQVKWPARLELLDHEPPVLLDVAHNPEGLAALAGALKAHFAGYRFVFVLGLLADKASSASLEPLVALADRIVVTEPVSPRALPADALAERLGGAVRTVVAPSPTQALRLAQASAQPGELIVVAGSHYLCGPIRSLLRPY